MNNERFSWPHQTTVADTADGKIVLIESKLAGETISFYHRGGRLFHIRHISQGSIRDEIVFPMPAYSLQRRKNWNWSHRRVWAGTYKDTFERLPCIWELDQQVFKDSRHQTNWSLSLNGRKTVAWTTPRFTSFDCAGDFASSDDDKCLIAQAAEQLATLRLQPPELSV